MTQNDSKPTNTNLTVSFLDLCAFAKSDMNQTMVLFPEVRTPRNASVGDPNQAHHLAVRAPFEGTEICDPLKKDTIRIHLNLKDDSRDSYVWFPVDCDLRIRTESNSREGLDANVPPEELANFGTIYSDKPQHRLVNDRLTKRSIPEGDLEFVKGTLDGRFLIDQGSLTVANRTELVERYDTTYLEGNIAPRPYEHRIATCIRWEIVAPGAIVLEARKFGRSRPEDWKPKMKFEQNNTVEVLNTPAASLIGVKEWYKWCEGDRIHPEQYRSKHFELFSKLCRTPPTPRECRIPYYTEPATPSKAACGSDDPLTHIVPVFCPQAQFPSQE